MKRVFIFGFSLLVLLISPAFSQETITITTFYPSPIGVYSVLRLSPHDNLNPDDVCSNEGEMYYDASDGRIYVCDGFSWGPIAGLWTLSDDGTEIYANDPDWNVGIGRIDPQVPLHIQNTEDAFGFAIRLTRNIREWDIDLKDDGVFTIGDNTAGADRLVIDTGGNVGIGTATPGSYRLNVAGNLNVSGQIDGSHGVKNCYWTPMITHGNVSCPAGYYVKSICLTNDKDGCNPAITGGPGDQSTWVAAGGAECCQF